MRIISNVELNAVSGGAWYDNWDDFKEALGSVFGSSPSSTTPAPAPSTSGGDIQTVTITGTRLPVAITTTTTVTLPSATVDVGVLKFNTGGAVVTTTRTVSDPGGKLK